MSDKIIYYNTQFNLYLISCGRAIRRKIMAKYMELCKKYNALEFADIFTLSNEKFSFYLFGNDDNAYHEDETLDVYINTSRYQELMPGQLTRQILLFLIAARHNYAIPLVHSIFYHDKDDHSVNIIRFSIDEIKVVSVGENILQKCYSMEEIVNKELMKNPKLFFGMNLMEIRYDD